MAKQAKKVVSKKVQASKPAKAPRATVAKVTAKAKTRAAAPKASAKSAKPPRAEVSKAKDVKSKVAKPKASKPKGVAAEAVAHEPVKAAPVVKDDTYQFAVEAARLAHDDKCTDVVLLDVRGLSQVTDYIIVGTGSSERQMRSVLDHIQELGAARNYRVFRTNTDERSLWLLADFVNVVVHLFEPATRSHYDLEMLWGDAPRIEWERPDQMNRDRAGLKA